MKTKRLLIVRCGQRKSQAGGKIPALQRYKGQLFNTINSGLKARRGLFSEGDVSVFILSAEFGLISGDEKIPLYNRKMDKERALELRPATLAILKEVALKLKATEIVLLLSSVYGEVLGPPDIEALWPNCKLISLNSSHQSTKQLGGMALVWGDKNP